MLDELFVASTTAVSTKTATKTMQLSTLNPTSSPVLSEGNNNKNNNSDTITLVMILAVLLIVGVIIIFAIKKIRSKSNNDNVTIVINNKSQSETNDDNVSSKNWMVTSVSGTPNGTIRNGDIELPLGASNGGDLLAVDKNINNNVRVGEGSMFEEDKSQRNGSIMTDHDRAEGDINLARNSMNKNNILEGDNNNDNVGVLIETKKGLSDDLNDIVSVEDAVMDDIVDHMKTGGNDEMNNYNTENSNDGIKTPSGGDVDKRLGQNLNNALSVENVLMDDIVDHMKTSGNGL